MRWCFIERESEAKEADASVEKKTANSDRSDKFPELLQLIRFPAMIKKQLEDVEKDPVLMKHGLMKDLLLEAWKVKAFSPLAAITSDSIRTKKRKSLALGGDDESPAFIPSSYASKKKRYAHRTSNLGSHRRFLPYSRALGAPFPFRPPSPVPVANPWAFPSLVFGDPINDALHIPQFGLIHNNNNDHFDNVNNNNNVNNNDNPINRYFFGNNNVHNNINNNNVNDNNNRSLFANLIADMDKPIQRTPDFGENDDDWL